MPGGNGGWSSAISYRPDHFQLCPRALAVAIYSYTYVPQAQNSLSSSFRARTVMHSQLFFFYSPLSFSMTVGDEAEAGRVGG